MCPLPPSSSRTDVSLRHTTAVPRSSQGMKLPLHYAAAKGAPFEVMEVLLSANLKAITTTDKARC